MNFQLYIGFAPNWLIKLKGSAHEVSSNFTGCLSHVYLNNRDLLSNAKLYDVANTCNSV